MTDISEEHENAYVRSSAAAALADAVELWPQTVTSTLQHLEEFYREKVSNASSDTIATASHAGTGQGPGS